MDNKNNMNQNVMIHLTGNVNIDELKECLLKNGYTVDSIKQKANKYEVGGMVKMSKDITILKDTLVKTSNQFLLFPKVELPQNTECKIIDVKDNSLVLEVNAYIRSEAIDMNSRKSLESDYFIYDIEIPLSEL